jgi:integrase
MAFLGRATGQRPSDLVKMRPADLTADGINVRIQKLGGKAHMVPLTTAQKSWPVRDLQFFVTSPTRKKLSSNYLNHLWTDWRASEAAEPIRDLKMTVHGLRSTAINDRRREAPRTAASPTSCACRSRWFPAICASPTRWNRRMRAVTAANENRPKLQTRRPACKTRRR